MIPIFILSAFIYFHHIAIRFSLPPFSIVNACYRIFVQAKKLFHKLSFIQLLHWADSKKKYYSLDSRISWTDYHYLWWNSIYPTSRMFPKEIHLHVNLKIMSMISHVDLAQIAFVAPFFAVRFMCVLLRFISFSFSAIHLIVMMNLFWNPISIQIYDEFLLKIRNYKNLRNYQFLIRTWNKN